MHPATKIILAALSIIVSFMVILAVLGLVNSFIFHLPSLLVLGVWLSPLLLWVLFFGFNFKPTGVYKKACSLKYSFLIPLSFKQEFDFEIYNESHVTDFAETFQFRPGDIILTRKIHESTRFVFMQNSYFTHAGIFDDVVKNACAGEKDYVNQVWHATAKNGAHHEDLLKFIAGCYIAAVVRFAPDHALVVASENKIRKNLLKLDKLAEKLEETQRQEFEEVVSALIQKDDFSRDPHLLQELACSIATARKGNDYDFYYEFKNAKKQCCIEYVWNCFGFLSPVHKVSLRRFTFFYIPVTALTPDSVLTSKSFKLEKCSSEALSTEAALSAHAQKHRLSIFRLQVQILVYELLILGMLYLIKLALM